MSEQQIKVGDTVEVVAFGCEMRGERGKVIEISDIPGDDLPYMVQFFKNLRVWPFSAEELELKDLGGGSGHDFEGQLRRATVE